MIDIRDRLVLRELADRYAQGVDRRRAGQVAELFTEDGELLIHGARDAEPRRRYAGRAAIEAALAGLHRFRATSHLVANQLLDGAGDRVEGETYCLASHVYDTDDGPRVYLMSVRYEDVFVRSGGEWRIAVRRERVDWAEDRAFSERDV